MGDTTRSCSICKTTKKELRPYGPGGADICFPCMKDSPELEAEASRNFVALLSANEALGNGVVVIGEEDGPSPFEVPA